MSKVITMHNEYVQSYQDLSIWLSYIMLKAIFSLWYYDIARANNKKEVYLKMIKKFWRQKITNYFNFIYI